MVEMTGLDNASLVSFSSISSAENSKSKNSSYKNTFKKTNNNNPKQSGSEIKPS